MLLVVVATGCRCNVAEGERHGARDRGLEGLPYLGSVPARGPQVGAQRLENENTLIVESDRGRVLEVTRGGDVVWEYFTPLHARDPGRRTAPYQVRRLPPEEARSLPWSGEVPRAAKPTE